jgi:hypothetical protein
MSGTMGRILHLTAPGVIIPKKWEVLKNMSVFYGGVGSKI